jgi:sarcosine oxidase
MRTTPRGPSDAADVVVVGAGVMGAWTAFWTQQAGFATTLVDAYGVGSPRATSSDVSRTIRLAHGSDSFYSTWARESREDWRRFSVEWRLDLLIECGTLWFARREDGFEAASEATLRHLGVAVEHLGPEEISARWPAISAGGLAFGLLEPEGGAIRAQASLEAVAAAFQRDGGRLRTAVLRPGRAEGQRLLDVVAPDGTRLAAETFVFACGPWLPSLFPDVLGSVIRVTKQDMVYLGPPGGDARFSPDAFPTWVEYEAGFWGLPDVDGHGVKLGPDRLGPVFDPSNGERIVDAESVRLVRDYAARRFPSLAARPVVETRVCQYESTPDTQFIIDRHPQWANVWLVGGGSGHGFKHGPRIGRYVTDRIRGRAPEPDDERFSISRPRTAKASLRAGGDAMVADWREY